jgi:dihydrofolate reductase
MPHPPITLVAAVARNGGIGRNNALLWSDPADQRHFRQLTMGNPVLMGRKTWGSLPARFRPLPGRRNLVLTRQPHWSADGAEAVPSLHAALERCASAHEVFVIGGAEIYTLALPLASTLVLTEIDADFPADAHFPAFDRAGWEVQASAQHVASDGTTFRFVTYRTPGGA